jgi:Tfp pilus assembly protein PilF
LATLGTITALLTWSGAGCASHTKQDAEASQLRFQIAADSFRTHRDEAALAEIEQALVLDPKNADAFNLKGLIRLSQGAEYNREVEVLTCMKGEDAVSLRRDAGGKFRQAEADFRRAVALRQDFPDAWNNLAVAMLQLEDFSEAATAAAHALTSLSYGEPEVARANLGWALYKKGDLQGAWKELHEAAVRSPGFCVGHYRLAKVYMDRGAEDEAAEEVDAVVSRRECPIQEAFLLAGLVHHRRQEMARAKELFSHCIALAPRGCLAAECRRYEEMIQ